MHCDYFNLSVCQNYSVPHLSQLILLSCTNQYRISGYIDRGKLIVNFGYLIYWSVCLSNRKGGKGLKGVDGDGEYRYYSQLLGVPLY